MKKAKLTSKGFTIVEVLVCIAVAAVVTMSLNQVTTSYLHTAKRGRYLNLANAFVEAKIESLRNVGYNGLSLGTTNLTAELSTQLPPSRSASMAVTDAAASAGLKQIDITISYKDQGQTNSYSYTTYIGELGVGQ